MGNIRGYLHPYLGEEGIAVGAFAALRPIGLHREHPPGSRPRHRQGPRAAADDGRAAGPRDRLLPRPGRLDARVQPRAPEPGRQRRGRGRHAPRGGRRVRHPAQGRDGHRGLVLQRRRVRQRRLPRGAQPRRDLSPAGGVRAREQPLRGVHAHPRLGARWRTCSERAAGYGMPGVTVDGNDAVAGAGGDDHGAVARARAGEGPTLIECKTYPPRRPPRQRPGAVPAQGGAGALAGPRPAWIVLRQRLLEGA